MKKTFKDFAEACWDTHKQVGFKMKGGKRVPNCVPKNEEDELNELGPAAMKRLARRACLCCQNNGKVWSGRQDGHTCIKGQSKKKHTNKDKVMNKFITVILCAMLLSSCALLDKLTGNTEVAVPTPIRRYKRINQ